MTMAGAIREALIGVGGRATREQLRTSVETRYPGQWRPNTLTAHLYACCVNSPKAYVHHPNSDRFMFKTDDGGFEMYDAKKHGPNTWAPGPAQSPAQLNDEAESELVAVSISLERDMESFVAGNLDRLEEGLQFVDRQVETDVGRIDIVATDSAGTPVLIELKVGDAGDRAVGQLARYLGWWTKAKGVQPRGFLIAAGIPDTVAYGASVLPRVTLRRYRVHLSFEAPEAEL